MLSLQLSRSNSTGNACYAGILKNNKNCNVYCSENEEIKRRIFKPFNKIEVSSCFNLNKLIKNVNQLCL